MGHELLVSTLERHPWPWDHQAMDEPTFTEIRPTGKVPPRPLVFLGIAAAVAVDYVAFRFLFDTNFFRWYVSGGPLIATVLVGVSKAFDFDQEPERIESDPNLYAGAWLQTHGIAMMLMSAIIKERAAKPLDALASMLVGIGFALAAFAYLAVVCPIQYFVTLLTGAPARVALRSTSAFRVTVTNPGDSATSPPERPPPGADRIGLLRDNAVTVTSAITAGFLFALSQLI
jgi:hypothetical protein